MDRKQEVWIPPAGKGQWSGHTTTTSGHLSVPTKDARVQKEAKDTHGINSGGSSNGNMASDFSTHQSHATKDGCSVISKGWRVRGALSSGFIN